MDILEYTEISEILKNKNPDEYLLYLEKEKLFPEAVDFINNGKTSEYLAFDYYKRNKKEVVRDAEDFFIKRINKEPAFTGGSHYMKITEAIEQISVINRDRAGRISDELRTNFKRRSSLIKVISPF